MFSAQQFLPAAVLEKLTDTRVHDPEFVARSARCRIRRTRLAPGGKLNILAADHPARRVTGVGNDALAMCDRHEYLARILRVLAGSRVDGVMATMDILDDLMIIDGLLREAGGAPLLDGKLAIASLNRGGLAGSAWELDDPVTGPSPAVCQERLLDGVKLLLRVDDNEPASLRTLLACAVAISESSSRALPVFLEPLPVNRAEKGYTVVKTAEALARLAGVASALGDSSRYLWLKLPYCEGYGAVARSTTLPILLLGGESAGDAAPFLGQLRSALAAGSNVRGALVGRNVLYPGAEDPLAVADAAGGIIHEGWTVEEAIHSYDANRGRDMDRIARHFPS
ncbi:MAG TPA: deoxyribose-phosphate aldolase [Bryobacteraceae bacterium]|nr:deoxyribose-phosphate aldolase [Bryobacteraceae bacterium]